MWSRVSATRSVLMRTSYAAPASEPNRAPPGRGARANVYGPLPVLRDRRYVPHPRLPRRSSPGSRPLSGRARIRSRWNRADLLGRQNEQPTGGRGCRAFPGFRRSSAGRRADLDGAPACRAEERSQAAGAWSGTACTTSANCTCRRFLIGNSTRSGSIPPLTGSCSFRRAHVEPAAQPGSLPVERTIPR